MFLPSLQSHKQPCCKKLIWQDCDRTRKVARCSWLTNWQSPFGLTLPHISAPKVVCLPNGWVLCITICSLVPTLRCPINQAMHPCQGCPTRQARGVGLFKVTIRDCRAAEIQHPLLVKLAACTSTHVMPAVITAIQKISYLHRSSCLSHSTVFQTRRCTSNPSAESAEGCCMTRSGAADSSCTVAYSFSGVTTGSAFGAARPAAGREESVREERQLATPSLHASTTQVDAQLQALWAPSCKPRPLLHTYFVEIWRVTTKQVRYSGPPQSKIYRFTGREPCFGIHCGCASAATVQWFPSLAWQTAPLIPQRLQYKQTHLPKQLP